MENQQQYIDFLTSKINVAQRKGIEVSAADLHPSGKFHQDDIILWDLSMGAALIAADTGMGKTHMAIETLRILQKEFGGKCLIVTELGAAETFVNEDPEVGEGARLGVRLEYVTNQAEAFESECELIVTNYERVRMGEFDFGEFTAVWLDEGNYVKNMASETTDSLQRELAKVKFKYIATATPSPNETLELVNYAHVLGIADRGQILTRFFQRNSTKAGELTLHPQHEDDFWMWVYSWAVFIQRPSDLGYDDEGYALPPLNVYWHEVKISQAIEGKVDRDGQKEMFVSGSASLPDAAKIKRASIKDRLAAAMAIINKSPDDHWLIWHHLEDERKAIEKEFKDHPSFASVYGSLNWKEKEKRIVDFSKGDLQVLATKPEISGVGVNFQKHCFKNIGLGVNHSFDELYQWLKRTHRYGQDKPVEAHIFYTPEEYDIVNNLKQKWEEHDIARAKMRDIVLKYGLNHSKFVEEKRRSFKTDRKVYKGDNYTLINTDTVPETASMPDNSVDMILTSIPFGNHYEYTDKYNDFGHNTSNDDFFRQMGFLVPELLRVLKPGRIAAIHTKNRIHYGSVTGLGFSTFHRFTHKACDSFEAGGFHCMGYHIVPTDVVAENNQTYRLGYSEACKDMTKMGAGIPEEIWIFRKSPSSNTDAYADEPVTHDKSEYSLSNWQIDADAFWRSSGNRYLIPEELQKLNLKQVRKMWDKFNQETIYDYEGHVELMKELDRQDKLSRTFTTIPLRSTTPYIWNDVNRMHGLNMEQSRRKQQNHICPMPFDQVDRLIELYSNKGDTIYDPFGGLCTTGVRAIKKGRKAILTELNDTYAKCGAIYLRETEYKAEIPTLFDVVTKSA